MSLRSFCISLIVLQCAASTAHAQARAVQLPTFRFFGVRTSVLVPDSGAGVAASMNRRSAGSSSLGVPVVGKAPLAGRPFRGAGIGRDVQAGQLGVRAQIHDFEAADKALLDRTATDAKSPAIRSGSLTDAPASLAEIRRQHAAQQGQRDVEAQAWLDRALQAEAAGKPGVARVYYRMAADLSAGNLRAAARSNLDGQLPISTAGESASLGE